LHKKKNMLIFHMGMDQYLLIPFLMGWTSINPSYFDVNYRGTRVVAGLDLADPACSHWRQRGVTARPQSSALERHWLAPGAPGAPGALVGEI
jgi:hypothetical protein